MRRGRKTGLVFRSVRRMVPVPSELQRSSWGVSRAEGPLCPILGGSRAGRGHWPLPRAGAGAWKSGQRPAPGALGVGWERRLKRGVTALRSPPHPRAVRWKSTNLDNPRPPAGTSLH